MIAILPTAERKPVVRLSMPLAPIEMLLVLGMIIWGTHYSVAKAALSVLPPFLFNALRFSAAVATLYLIMRASSELFALKRSAILRLIFTSFLLHVLYQVFFINGLRYTTVANSVLISTIAPVGVIIVNILLRRERGSWRLFSGMSLAFGGVLIVILALCRSNRLRHADDLARRRADRDWHFHLGRHDFLATHADDRQSCDSDVVLAAAVRHSSGRLHRYSRDAAF